LAKQSDFLARALVTIIFSYAVSVGATFNGIFDPALRSLTLAGLGLLVAAWLLVHWRRGWRWHRTPLDAVFLLWTASFALSLLANTDTWRRQAIGLWYVGLYIGMWYVLTDCLSNGGLIRRTLVDGLLIGGFVVLIFGYLQTYVFLSMQLRGGLPLTLPRPVSTLGNANALGNFLVVLIPFALTACVSARAAFVKVLMGLYTLLALVLLFLSFSRGAWLGTAVGLVVWGVLWLAGHDLLGRHQLKTWWARKATLVRVGVVAGALAGLVVAALAGVIFVRSLNETGRTTDLRTYIWEAAFSTFRQKPLTGYGLYTFGRNLVLYNSMPPENPHSHAHDAPLHIAAELGLVGLAALLITLIVIFRAARRNWREADARGRSMLTAAAGAVTAFAVHQLLDVPAMMPAIALCGLLALALLLTPFKPVPIQASWRRNALVAALVGLWAVLLGGAVWENQLYIRYVDALDKAAPPVSDYAGAADEIQTVIDADPALSFNYMQQGFLYGMAAEGGDKEAAWKGVAAYEHFVALEPNYASAWANLGGLYRQLDEWEKALAAMQRAARLAPKAWQLWANVGQYAAAMGDPKPSAEAYQQMVDVYPDAALYPELSSLPLPASAKPLSTPALVVQQLEAGNTQEAADTWARDPQPPGVSTFVISELLSLAAGDRAGAADWLAKAEKITMLPTDQAWLHLGKARLARYDQDAALVEQEVQAARTALEQGPLDGDWEYGLSIGYAQFMRLAVPRQFLPQVYYPVDDPVLIHLINYTQG
jgi:O-antigen ligase/tetratricopeptide (TPR) repeat protein